MKILNLKIVFALLLTAGFATPGHSQNWTNNTGTGTAITGALFNVLGTSGGSTAGKRDLIYYTFGAERMRLMGETGVTQGYLGLGTATPAYRFHLVNANSSTWGSTIGIDRPGNTYAAGILWSTAGVSEWTTGYDGTTNSHWMLKNSGTPPAGSIAEAIYVRKTNMVSGLGYNYVGIGTITPGNRVEINTIDASPTTTVGGSSGLRFTDLTSATTPDGAAPTSNVLSVNSTGDVILIPGNGIANDWHILGNAATLDGTNFLGTTDAVALNFRVNNLHSGRIDLAGACNTSFGYQSLPSYNGGRLNVGAGYLALFTNKNGDYNTATGANAMYLNKEGDMNTAAGFSALYNNFMGSENVGIGYSAMITNTDGTQNTVVGSRADVGSALLNNASAIGAGAVVTGSNEMILGNSDVRVGIGLSGLTPGPANYLEINADPTSATYTGVGGSGLRFRQLTSASTAVTMPNFNYLTVDANGDVVLAASNGGSGVYWELLGNAGTVDGTHFIGTTDYVPVNIRVMNVPSGRIEPPGMLDVTSYGYEALLLGTSAVANTAIGNYALSSNVSGIHNTAVGTWALRSCTGGTNSAFGTSALLLNTTGYNNTGIGAAALGNNVSGNFNAGVGEGSLLLNSSGSYNSGIGRHALAANTTGSYNTALGFAADVSTTNLTNATAVGANAVVTASNAMVLGDNNVNVGIGLSGITPGPGNKLEINTGVSGSSGLRFRQLTSASTPVTMPNFNYLTVDANGDVVLAASNGGQGVYWALLGNAGTVDGTNFIGTTDNVPFNIRVNNQPSGRIDHLNNNASFGHLAFASFTTAQNNTAMGSSALGANTTGNFNTAIGSSALPANVSGIGNTASGMYSLWVNAGGHMNTSTGFSSLSNSDGSYNTGMGAYSLSNNVTGSYNSGLGYNATVGSTSFNNSTAVGALSATTTSDQVMLGNTSILTVNAGPGAAIIWTSDGRYKTDVKANVPGLEFINALRPVTYKWDLHKLNEKIYGDKTAEYEQAFASGLDAKSKLTFTGFIAQEVEAAADKAGFDFSGVHKPQSDKDIYGLDYAEFVVPLVKAVQEQQDEIEARDEQISALQSQVETLQSQMAALTSMVQNCCAAPADDRSGTGAGNLNGNVLEQNVPNPFSENTTIRYYVAVAAPNTFIKVKSLNGIEVASFPITAQGSGQIMISGHTLSQGEYLYELIVDGVQVASKRMVLTR